MKRSWVLSALCCAVVPLAFWATHRLCLTRDCDEVTWFTKEFRLSASQREAIIKLKTEYEPICAAHCAKIERAREAMEALEKGGKTDSSEFQNAKSAFDSISEDCRRATIAHVRAVAALMDPDEGKRYLDMILPHLEVQTAKAHDSHS